MIISKEVEVKVGNTNKAHYRSLGYSISKNDKKIFVKVGDLLPTTRVNVVVECDYCNSEVETNYKNYFRHEFNRFSCSPKCTYEKTKENNLAKYGVECVNQSPQIKEKTFNNSLKNIKKYDIKLLKVENSDYIKYIMDKEVVVSINRWNINFYKKLGYNDLVQNQKWVVPVQHLMENSSVRINCKCDCGEIINNSFQKFMINYKRSGTYNCKSCNNITYKKSFLKKYGVENGLQDVDIFNRGQVSGLKIKEYKGIKYQGTYELDFLVYCDSVSILNKISKVRSIRYKFNGKDKYYHPDFYIKELNLIIEVKSDYYYELYLEKNIAKEESCTEQGYNFLFVINKNYMEFDQKIECLK